MKILVIEDEKIERITIENTLNVHFPHVLIETASNSIDAMNLYQSFCPDIVMSDINIPGGMNGLEVISQMKALRDCLFLIITSYSSFDYIQQAIRLGINSFLLKPLNEEKLVQNVSQLIQQYEQNQIEKKRQSVLYERLQEMMPILKRNLFYAIMQNETPYEIQSALQYLEWDCSDAICLVFHEKAFHDMNLFLRIIEYRFPTFYILYNRHEEHFVVYLMKKGRFDQEEAKILEKELNEVFQQQEVKVSGFISGCEHFYSLYHFALYTKQQRNFKYVDFVHEQTLNIDEFCDEVISLGYERKISELNFKLNAFQQYLGHRTSDEQNYELYAFIQRMSSKSLRLSNEEMNHILSLNTLSERISKMQGMIQEHFSQRRHHGISQKVKQYIEQNYMKQISLQSLADYLDLTPFYVSRLVKEEFSQTFTELLVQYRMEQAKKYLRQDCKIKEAALLSGFGDVNYFSKVFKKMTGLSPKEYQKKICD